jgi:hypothetical protein
MNLCRLIGRLLAVFVIASLVTAPLVTPAAAKRLAVAEMTDMAAMSGDMPCCQDRQNKNECKDCPLIAMCLVTIALAEPSATNSIEAPLQTRRLHFAFDDTIADGLIGTPPDHPPRIST